MERVRGKTPHRRRRLHGKLAADSRAHALVPVIRELRAAGFISRRSLANELNRRGIPTARGGRWHYTTVVWMLARLGLLTSGKGGRINNRLASKQAADARAKALASTIRALQVKDLVSFSAIARELNEREIPTALSGKWHPASVSRLLHRLALSRRSRSSSRHRR